jgi:EAL domain-containing protein (putative c-di-GMP-specific phosphodiesterase class I)
MPVRYVKIDGTFVKDIVMDPVDQAMVRSINQIAHSLGMETIAEFVESDAILEKLGLFGVDYAQGYAIGRPGPQI